MRILYIGETSTHQMYENGNVPSHWFYGACEMERDGHEVIWAQESDEKLNDLKLIYRHKPDIIFIPNLNIHNHLLLLSLAGKAVKTPIYAYLHHEPRVKHGIKAKIYRYLLSSINHMFFLSEKTMDETVNSGLIGRERCSLLNWGPDMDFYSKIKTSDNGWFVSTGKENRDFDILIEAFRQIRLPLHILTAKSHNGVEYSNLAEKCKDIPNIKVTIVENSGHNYQMMLHEMASAHALVCPLRQDRLNYCVGLSTVADAEGLKKPLLITSNPYHSDERISRCGIKLSNVDDWVSAITTASKIVTDSPKHTMETAYQSMKRIMNL